MCACLLVHYVSMMQFYFVSLSMQFQSYIKILLVTLTIKHGIAIFSQVHTGLLIEYFIAEPDV